MVKKGKRVICLPLLDDGENTIEIGVNGVMFILKRGQDAEVDAQVFEVLRNAGLLEDGER